MSRQLPDGDPIPTANLQWLFVSAGGDSTAEEDQSGKGCSEKTADVEPKLTEQRGVRNPKNTEMMGVDWETKIMNNLDPKHETQRSVHRRNNYPQVVRRIC